ncbi:MAG: PIN domain-containing protein [Actinobacteria bacterium]|nr:PIN domain-containing protein [Actinomycetota bacterium]
MLLDANILLYAVDTASPFHDRARSWLTAQLNGSRRVGFPWQSLVAFIRISTHERASASPLAPEEAVGFVADWLEPDVSWIPREGPGHGRILADLVMRHQLRGNIVSDAHLAALAIEHGLEVCSNDSDFARFSELRWVNPVAPGAHSS